MTENISILGSTGSIGTQTLDVVRKLNLKVSALTAASNTKIMEQQIREFKPKLAVMFNQQAAKDLKEKIADTDSVGGIIECVVKNMPAGVGEPVFEKLDANLAKAVMSIGAVKGVEIGDGFAVASACGSENNDNFKIELSNPQIMPEEYLVE
mgnify:CR=1 FL=1